jgi:hypothetical protein
MEIFLRIGLVFVLVIILIWAGLQVKSTPFSSLSGKER